MLHVRSYCVNTCGVGGLIMSMEVLLEIEGSRKELCVDRDNVIFIVEEELGKLGMDGILAYFSCVRGEQHRTDKRVYILQRWAEKWKNFVDVTDVDQINNGDRLTVVLESTNPAVVNVAVSEPSGSFDVSRSHVSVFCIVVMVIKVYDGKQELAIHSVFNHRIYLQVSVAVLGNLVKLIVRLCVSSFHHHLQSEFVYQMPLILHNHV